MTALAKEQQQAWRCPEVGLLGSTADENCLSVIEDVSLLTEEPCLKKMTTCPMHYKNVAGISGQRGVIAAHNFCKENRIALQILYGSHPPAVIVDGLQVLDQAIVRKEAAEERRREHDRERGNIKK